MDAEHAQDRASGCAPAATGHGPPPESDLACAPDPPAGPAAPAAPDHGRPAAKQGHSHHGHGHGHSHPTGTGRQRGRLTAVLIITVAVLLAELVGAWWSGSLALLADAGHLATDAGGVALALFAAWMATRPATSRRTFGWQRAEILAAAVNALVLLGLAGFILVEAARRLLDPRPVEAGVMLAFGVVGVVGNAVSVGLLVKGQHDSLNVRAAFLEVLADLLASVAVVVAAGIAWATGFTRADALVSVAIGLLIVPRTLKLLREALDVLLEAAPKHVELAEVRRHMLRNPGVRDVHDLHAWTITSGVPVMSAHVVVADEILTDGGYGRLLDDLHNCLAGHFDVEHSTLQLAPAGHADHEGARHE